MTVDVGERGGAVWLAIGVQAAGKSTVADGLARRFDRGVHVRGGQFSRWAVRGWVHAGDAGQPDAARRHLELRYRLSATVADEYGRAGFTTVVQDNVFGDDVVAWLSRISTRPRYLVVLRPSPAVVAERDDERRRATGKVAYRPGESTIADLDGFLDETPRIGLWLDTSSQSATETVDEILTRRAEALIDALPPPATASGGQQ